MTSILLVTYKCAAHWKLTTIFFFMHDAGDRLPSYRGHYMARAIPRAVSAAAPGKGGGLLERPTVETTTPGRESEFDLRYFFNCKLAIRFSVAITLLLIRGHKTTEDVFLLSL